MVVHRPVERVGLDDKILLWMGKGEPRMAYDLGLGDDDMNRGSSQAGVKLRGGGTPNARVDDLRSCDKCNGTCRREEMKKREEGGREGEGTKRRRARVDQLRLAGRRFPTHTLDRRFKWDATGHALFAQWSGSSNTTSKNYSKKSIF